MAEQVPRWRVPLVGALALVVVGLLTAEPFLLVATAVPLVYVAYGALSRVPADASVAIERTVETTAPTPGEVVWVELAVTNDGPAALTDLRVVDGVPAELRVVEGSPRGCLSLSPGESATIRYALLAKRADYAFEAPSVRIRPLAATQVLRGTVAVQGATSLTVANAVSEVPLADATLPRAGTLPTDSGGSGLEFHATRDYQPGDPVSRIDWRRFAKTNTLTTVEYREEQAVRTILVVDARPVTRTTALAGYPTGAELSAYAAERLFDALRRANVVASVVAVGLSAADVPGGLDPDGFVWVDPGGRDTAERAAQVFDGVQAATRTNGSAGDAAASSSDGSDEPASQPATDGGPETAAITRLLARLPPTAQVVCCSPLLDEWPATLVARLRARGYPTTVVSPDVTQGGGLAQTVTGIERQTRLRQVELAGATRIDWTPDEPIDIALRASLADLYST
jgi:uncharacterized repeat protein (TIGR01451 family)